MKKSYLLILILSILFLVENFGLKLIQADDSAAAEPAKVSVKDNKTKESTAVAPNSKYIFPEFYKGIYLNIASAKNFKKLKKFVKAAKKSHINTFVLDTQSSRYRKCIVPAKNVKYCIDNGVHPIARVVVFPHGLSTYPVPKSLIQSKLDIAESACKNGFKEIQFDYIRFNDSNRLRKLSRAKRYAFIEGFLQKARTHLKKYNVKIAADIFGRIPLNKGDIIGQRMEGLDKVVDIICPMAYPSHYWTRKLQHDPYYTVKWTSASAKKRTKNAQIVTYIQAFKWKMPSKMSYSKYIKRQIEACHDANIKGFFLWNARQDYKIPFKVTKKYYTKKNKQITRSDKLKNEEG
ncbi:MAG: hypothetical protein GY754_16130 [bacterium]|nr:hypothetical protein [bacterium]